MWDVFAHALKFQVMSGMQAGCIGVGYGPDSCANWAVILEPVDMMRAFIFRVVTK